MSATAIEQAWKTLEDAGVVTPADRALLEARARERAVAQVALAVLRDLRRQHGNIIEAVQVITGDRIVVAEGDGNSRVIPRLVRQTKAEAKAKADKAGKDTSDASEAEIPTEALKRASEELGVRWYGRANALRSQRVVSRARELAAAAG